MLPLLFATSPVSSLSLITRLSVISFIMDAAAGRQRTLVRVLQIFICEKSVKVNRKEDIIDVLHYSLEAYFSFRPNLLFMLKSCYRWKLPPPNPCLSFILSFIYEYLDRDCAYHPTDQLTIRVWISLINVWQTKQGKKWIYSMLGLTVSHC